MPVTRSVDETVRDEDNAGSVVLREKRGEAFAVFVWNRADYRKIEVARGKNASGSNPAVCADDIVVARGTNYVRNHGKTFIGTGDDKCFHSLTSINLINASFAI